MNNNFFPIKKLCAGLAGLVLAAGACAAGNDDVLVLNGPDNTRFEFVKVKVSGGNGPYAGQTFTMGDPREHSEHLRQR